MEARSDGMTYGDLQTLVQDAITDLVRGGDSDGYVYVYVWVMDMTDAVAIYSAGGDTFEVPYTVDDGNNVTLGDPVPVVRVTTYAPVTDGRSGRALFPPPAPTEARTAPVRVKSEPLVYRKDVRASYFRDLALRNRNADAFDRLERHGRQMDDRAQRMEREARAAGPKGVEYRANPDRTFGQGGYFAPPAWIIEQFATAKRPQRVLADLIKAAGGWFPLPHGVQSVNLPRLTTGTTDQAESDLEPDAETDVVDASATSPVVTFSGQSDVSMQDLEQSPPSAALDWAIWKDLTASYDADLETMLLVGTGTGPQWLGLTQLSGINSVTYTSGSPTLEAMWTYFGQAAAQIGDARDIPPEVWLMRTARWSWVGSSEDDQHRPIVPPELARPDLPRTDGVPTAVGSILGWPVHLSDAIPATLGTPGNQDEIIACIPSDLLLWEGEPITSVLTEVLSGTLQARIQLRCPAAAILGRYPSGVSTIAGTGFVVQSGF